MKEMLDKFNKIKSAAFLDEVDYYDLLDLGYYVNIRSRLSDLNFKEEDIDKAYEVFNYAWLKSEDLSREEISDSIVYALENKLVTVEDLKEMEKWELLDYLIHPILYGKFKVEEELDYE